MLYLDMTPGVLSRTKGCPEQAAADALRDACIEFCSETYWLTTGVEVVTDGTEVPITDLHTQVIDVIDAKVPAAREPRVRVTFMNDDAVEDLDDGEYALQFADPNNGVLTPPGTVDAPVSLELLLAIAPGPESTEVPDLLWQRWAEDLRHGALARLFEEPGKAWSNPELAMYHRGKFDAAIKKAAAQAGRNRMNVARRLRVKPV